MYNSSLEFGLTLGTYGLVMAIMNNRERTLTLTFKGERTGRLSKCNDEIVNCNDDDQEDYFMTPNESVCDDFETPCQSICDATVTSCIIEQAHELPIFTSNNQDVAHHSCCCGNAKWRCYSWCSPGILATVTASSMG